MLDAKRIYGKMTFHNLSIDLAQISTKINDSIWIYQIELQKSLSLIDFLEADVREAASHICTCLVTRFSLRGGVQVISLTM